MKSLLFYGLGFLILMLAELVYLRVGRQMGWVSIATPRSSHTEEKVIGGGWIFVLAVWLAACFVPGVSWEFVAAVTFLGAVSFADDLHSLPVFPRFIVQIAAVALMMYSRHYGDFLSIGWLVLAGFFAVATVNAFNFMDGINGITGYYAASILLPLIYLSNSGFYVAAPGLLGLCMTAVVVFCFFNCRKNALCFAGDVGAITMGLLVSCFILSVALATGRTEMAGFVAVYGVDTFCTLGRRILRHEKVTTPHRLHAYQLLSNELGFPQLWVGGTYAILQLVINIALIAGMGWPGLGVCLFFLVGAYLIVVRCANNKTK